MITNMLAHKAVNKCPVLDSLRTKKILPASAFSDVPHASRAGHMRPFSLATSL